MIIVLMILLLAYAMQILGIALQFEGVLQIFPEEHPNILDLTTIGNE